MITFQGVLVDAINDSAFSLLSSLLRQDRNNSISVSPFNYSTILALLYSGADGETKRELGVVLGIDSLPSNIASLVFKTLHEDVMPLEQSSIFSSISSMWIRNKSDFLESYVQSVTRTFLVDFLEFEATPTATINRINTWVSNATHGTITTILRDEDLDPDTPLVMLGATYFKGLWDAPFKRENTEEETFYCSCGSRKLLPFMNTSSRFNYFNGDEIEIVRLPFLGGKYYMDILLPANGTFLCDVMKNINHNSWKAHCSNLSLSNVHLGIPRLHLEYELCSLELLRGLGLVMAASGQSDFSNMCKIPVSISEIRHKTDVIINEEGAEASAATSVLMGRALDSSYRMKVNRPFLYVIQDAKTGLFVFLGAVFNPSISGVSA